MPGATELPQLVTEFVDMSKEYLRQETVEPAKRLGRGLAGGGLGAAVLLAMPEARFREIIPWLLLFATVLFAIGGVLLAIAGMRGIIYLLPEGPNWSALGYILGALAIGVVIGAMVSIAGSGSDSKEV